MRVLSIAGTGSGVGKTRILALLLADPLAGWGALRTTPLDGHAPEAVGDDEFVTDPARIEIVGRDTRRLIDAGAARVAWLRARDAASAAALAPRVREHFRGLPGVAVEGGRLAEALGPGYRIFVAGSTWKPGSREAMARADVVVVAAPAGLPEPLPYGVRARSITLDPDRPGAGGETLVALVRAWSRWRSGTPSPSTPRS